MSSPLLSVNATCAGKTECIFDDKEISIDIAIENISQFDVDLPLRFIEAQGPSMTLIDKETQQKIPLRTALAPNELRKIFTTIRPGEVKHISTIIKVPEITTFRTEFVDLTVKLTVAAKAEVDGNHLVEVPVRADTIFQIIGKDTLKLKNRVNSEK